MENNNDEKGHHVRVCNRSWRKITPLNTVVKELPSPREKFSMNVYDYSLYIYGGLGINGAVLDDFYQFDIATRQWKKLKNKHGPGARHSHATAVYRHYLILHGGKNNKDNVLDDLWFYNFSTSTWNFIQNCRLPRYGHALNIIPGQNILRLIGANDLDHGIVYDWDLGDVLPKLQLQFQNYQKSPRSYFGAVTNDQCTLVYGGSDHMAILYSRYDRSQFSPDHSYVITVPVTRVNGVTVEYIDGRRILIGGLSEDKKPAKTQFFDKENDNKFIPLSETELGELPPLSYHRSVQTLNGIFVFGGVKSNGELSNELYWYSEDQTPVTVQLPDEIFVREICKHLPVYQLIKIARTSKHYCQVISELFKEDIAIAKVRAMSYSYHRPGIGIKLLQSGGGHDNACCRIGEALAQQDLADEIDPTLEAWTGSVQTCFGLVDVHAHILPSFAALCACDVSDPSALQRLEENIARYNQLCHIVILGYNSKTADDRVIQTSQLNEFAAKYPDAVVFEVRAINTQEVMPAFKWLAEKMIRRIVEQEAMKTNLFSDTDITKKGEKDKCTVM